MRILQNGQSLWRPDPNPPIKKQLRLVTCKLYNVIKFSILFHTHHRGRLPIDTIHPILVPRRSHVVMQFLFLYIIKFNIFVGEFNFKQILLLCSSAWECTCNKKNVRKMNEEMQISSVCQRNWQSSFSINAVIEIVIFKC